MKHDWQFEYNFELGITQCKFRDKSLFHTAYRQHVALINRRARISQSQ